MLVLFSPSYLQFSCMFYLRDALLIDIGWDPYRFVPWTIFDDSFTKKIEFLTIKTVKGMFLAYVRMTT